MKSPLCQWFLVDGGREANITVERDTERERRGRERERRERDRDREKRLDK